MEFTASGLTSYTGLELLLRSLRATGLNALLRQQLAGTKLRGDFGVVAMVRVVLGLLIVGGRRLRHLGYVTGDPIFHRFCGLAHLPSARTLSRWLKNFNESWVGRLRRVNAEVVARVVRHLPLKLETLIAKRGVSIARSAVAAGRAEGRAARGGCRYSTS